MEIESRGSYSIATSFVLSRSRRSQSVIESCNPKEFEKRKTEVITTTVTSVIQFNNTRKNRSTRVK
jgi:hypothetical protein